MLRVVVKNDDGQIVRMFQWAPTLGGECYQAQWLLPHTGKESGFNGHPPLGVNATGIDVDLYHKGTGKFQWAPTLGGECYFSAAGTIPAARACFNGHPPLGVNATGMSAYHAIQLGY